MTAAAAAPQPLSRFRSVAAAAATAAAAAAAAPTAVSLFFKANRARADNAVLCNDLSLLQLPSIDLLGFRDTLSLVECIKICG